MKILNFTLENNILTQNEITEMPDLSGEFRLRLWKASTGECSEKVLRDASYSNIIKQIESLCQNFCRHIFASDDDFNISRMMIRWLSKEAFACKQPFFTKSRMAMGYITAPELYSPELAAIYDEYIRKNAAKLLSRRYWSYENDKYDVLVSHVFSLGKPSKAAIINAVKHYIWRGDCETQRAELIERFRRLYPKSSADIKKMNMLAEAARRMEILKIYFGYVNNFFFYNKLTMTEQYYSDWKSDWSLKAAYPDKENLQLVKEAEKKYGALVYHIHKFCVNEEMTLYAFLNVSQYEEEWEYARKMADEGLPECIAPVYGYGGFEYGELPVETINGLLLRKY